MNEINTKKIPVVAPCIHLNGTSAESLSNAMEAAYSALYKARDLLRQCAPNGRDYYIGDVHLTQAEGQHRRRQLAIDAVMNSLETEMDLINQRQQAELVTP